MRRSGAFTLVELLLVMALLGIVLAVGMPQLAAFFRGRAIDLEARRLLALTHHGASRAVSEGIPMLLWVDAEERKYGLEAEPGWDERDPKAVELTLDKELKIEVTASTNNVQSFNLRTELDVARTALSDAQRKQLPQVRFLPDGSIDETSPESFELKDTAGVVVAVAQARNRLAYEIRNNRNANPER